MNSFDRHLSAILMLASATCAFAAGPGPAAKNPTPLSSAQQTRLVEGYGKLPLSFEPNQGQTDPQVKFLSRGDGYRLSLTPTEAVLSLPGKPCSRISKLQAMRRPLERPQPCASSPGSELRMRLLGSNPQAQIAGEDELPGKSNYFVGNDASAWRTNIPNYRRVQYQQVYPGIDLVYYGNQRHLEHDFIVAPGADPKAIRLNFTGADDLSIDRDGDLVLSRQAGTLRFKRPVVYQQIGGVRMPVAARYARTNSREIGFAIDAYDRKNQLVIDPVLVYSTYSYGTLAGDLAGIAVDSAGDAYVVGDDGNGNVKVSKLNPDGSAVVYSTVIGSARPSAIAVDALGNAYITGEVTSNSFPAVNAFQSQLNGYDAAFVTKLDPSGANLVYSTYFSGDSAYGSSIAVDSSGSAYITGYADIKLPVTTSLSAGTIGAYVTKFAPSGNSLEYSTYIAGSSGNDNGYAIAVDPAGEAIVTGLAQSTDFPLVNAFRTTCVASPYVACYDVFITKINAAGTGLLYSTFLAAGYGEGIATNADGDAFVTGFALTKGFPLVNALYPSTSGEGAVYVTRINATGSALVYSTFLGNSPEDAPSIAVDKDSNAYVAGYTASGFPIVNAVQPQYGGGPRDAFLSKISASGSTLLSSTYLGGSDDDAAGQVAVDIYGNAYLMGGTLSQNFPVQNALQPQPDPDSAGYYSFIAKISDASSFSIVNTVDNAVIGPGGDLHYNITVKNIGSETAGGTLTVTSLRDRFRTCTVSNGDPCKFVVLGGRATVNLTPLATGETRTILIYATAAMTAGDYNLIPNTATVSTGPPLNETDSATATTTVRETADIAIASSLVDSTNGLLHYVHTVTNLGPDSAHAVLLLDPLPANTGFTSASTTAGECSYHPTIGTYGAVRCPLNNPAAGSSVQVDVFIQAFTESCPTVTDTTTVTSQSIDTESGNDSATVVTQLPQSLCMPTPPPPPSYELTIFSPTDIRIGSTNLNNNGDLLGRGDQGPFIYKNGAQKALLLPSSFTYPISLNDADDVVGVNSGFQPVFYKNGTLQPLSFGPQYLGPKPDFINNFDQIVGTFTSAGSPALTSAFIYQNGATQDLGHLPNTSATIPTTLNQKGEIAGSYQASAFLFTHSLLLNIRPDYASEFVVFGIDSSGRVSGYFTRKGRNERHAFIYSGGTVQDLGSGLGPDVIALTMNDCGEVAGYNQITQHGFLYTHGGFVDLDSLISLPDGYVVHPMTLNNRGQILGSTFNPDIGGASPPVLLTPTAPEKCGSDATIDNTPDSATIAAAGTITYTIKAANLDTATTQFTVKDDLDPTTTVVSCTVIGGGGTCTATPGSHTVLATLPNLTKGATATVTVQVKAAATYAPQSVIMNTATLSSALTSDYLSTAYTSVP